MSALEQITQQYKAAHRISERVSWDDYRKLPGVSITRLKVMRRSAKHYRHALANPKESAPLTLGTAGHTAVLEPERFEAQYAVWGERTDSGRLRPRKSKDWDSFKALNSARSILTEDEHVAACAIRDAVRGDPVAMRYLAKGSSEVTLQWVDEETATQMKGRVDWLTEIDGVPVIVGLKTTRDVRGPIFGTQAAKFGYPTQWAAYFDGYIEITGVTPRIVEIVVENEAPYDVGVYVPGEEVLDIGRNEYREMLLRLQECERTGVWPGAVPNETNVILPAWAYETDNDIESLGLEGFDNE